MRSPGGQCTNRPNGPLLTALHPGKLVTPGAGAAYSLSLSQGLQSGYNNSATPFKKSKSFFAALLSGEPGVILIQSFLPALCLRARALFFLEVT